MNVTHVALLPNSPLENLLFALDGGKQTLNATGNET